MTNHSHGWNKHKVQVKLGLLPWGRIIFALIAIALQFGIVLFAVLKVSRAVPYIYLIFGAISLVCSILVWTSEINYAYKATWIITILLFPLFGGLLFVISTLQKAGTLNFSKYTDTANQIKKQLFKTCASDKEFKSLQGSYLRQMNHIQNTTFYPAYSDTSTLYYPSGEVFLKTSSLICAMQKNLFLWNFLSFLTENSGVWYTIF